MSDELAHTLVKTIAKEGVRSRTILDTSVLIADPGCLTHFSDTDVVIPLTVIEELDGLKSRMDDVGRAARTVLRAIEELRVRNGGSLEFPVPLTEKSNAATLQIVVNGIQRHLLIEYGLDPAIADNRIIGTALGLSDDADVTVVSNDAALRIKAAHLGLTAVEHCHTSRSSETRHPGWGIVEVDHSVVDRVYAHDRMDIDDLPGRDAVYEDERDAVYENEFLVLRAGSQSALVRRYDNELVLLGHSTPEAWGLRPRSKEQRFALELLLDPAVSVVALDGKAGTGKTLVAIAAALEQVVERKLYEKVAIYRPLIPVGRADVGFLPGGLEEKLDPWMSAIHDSIVALTDRQSQKDAQGLIDELTSRDQLSLESVTFLRGRSLHRQFVVVDEAQNLEPTTLKTILTRVGEGTKVVFTGDTSQIDAPYMSESNNALAVLIGAFRGQRCFGHITLNTCERSAVANLAAELL